MTKRTLLAFLMLVFAIGAKAQQSQDFFEIQVDGQGCPFCVYGLEKKLKEFKEISKIQIDTETGNFSFYYPANRALSLKEVEKKVAKAGFTPIAASVTRADGRIEARHETHITANGVSHSSPNSLKLSH